MRALRAEAYRDLRRLRARSLLRTTVVLLLIVGAAFALQEAGVVPVVDGSIEALQTVYTWFSDLVRVVVLGGEPRTSGPAPVIMLEERSPDEVGEAAPDAGAGRVIIPPERSPGAATGRDDDPTAAEPKPKARQKTPREPPPPKYRPRGVG